MDTLTFLGKREGWRRWGLWVRRDGPYVFVTWCWGRRRFTVEGLWGLPDVPHSKWRDIYTQFQLDMDEESYRFLEEYQGQFSADLTQLLWVSPECHSHALVKLAPPTQERVRRGVERFIKGVGKGVTLNIIDEPHIEDRPRPWFRAHGGSAMVSDIVIGIGCERDRDGLPTNFHILKCRRPKPRPESCFAEYMENINANS